jgi:NhaP-type Na+/H+ or K+/H+ antiporter
MLLLAGCAFRIAGAYMGDLDSSVQLIDNITHTTVLIVFMPALIFETCFATDWYTFRREIWQIIPLATTAVLLSAFLTAEMFIYILGYDLTLSEAMLIGTMLSATDHVAVVAQLKEIKASQKFELLVQGETLLNEGTVMVLISIFLFEFHENSSVSLAGLFFRLSLGSVALGLLFGILMCILLSKIQDDPVQETTLTIVTTYLLFYTAEVTFFQVSGALAIVAYGLFMSAWGKTVISPAVERDVHSFWNILSTNVESLVFVIGGMLLGKLIVTENELDGGDVGKMFACFVMLHIIRAIVILVHYPVLKYFGYGLSLKEALVLTLAGLKGAIAITLALMVYRTDEVNEDCRNLALFMTISIAALSILVDSIAIRFATKYLGLEKLSTVQENMMISVTNSLIEQTTHKLQSMRKREDMKLADWSDVIEIAGAKKLLARVFKNTKKGHKIIENSPDSNIPTLIQNFKSAINITSDEIKIEIRSRYLSSLKGIYWHLFEKSQCSGQTALALIKTANRSLDEHHEPMRDWQFAEKNLLPRWLVNFYLKASVEPRIGSYFRNKLCERMSEAYDIASTFMHAHHEAEELIDYMGIDEVDKEIFEEVMHEVHSNIHKADIFIKTCITDSYPEVLRYIQTKKAFLTLLNSQRKLIDSIYKQGVIGEIEHFYLLDSINSDSYSLPIYKYARLPSIKEILMNNFPEASEDQISLILSYSTEVSYEAGKIIHSLGSISTGAYIILKGRAREFCEGYQTDHVVGSMICLKNLLEHYDKYITTLEAATNVTAYKISPTILQELPEFEISIWKMCVHKILVIMKEQVPEIQENESEILRAIINKCSLKRYFKGDSLDGETGGILLYGQVGRYLGISYVPPDNLKYYCTTDKVIFMHFPSGLAERIKLFREPLHKAIIGFLRSNDSRFKLKGKALLKSLSDLSERSLPKLYTDTNINTETNVSSFEAIKLYDIETTQIFRDGV